MSESVESLAREIVARISDAAIELAFVRHDLTTTEYEEQEHTDVEEGVEAFKELVEEVKADVLACLTGDEEGCLDPEDVDNDNEMQWLIRQLPPPPDTEQPAEDEVGSCPHGMPNIAPCRECLPRRAMSAEQSVRIKELETELEVANDALETQAGWLNQERNSAQQMRQKCVGNVREMVEERATRAATTRHEYVPLAGDVGTWCGYVGAGMSCGLSRSNEVHQVNAAQNPSTESGKVERVAPFVIVKESGDKGWDEYDFYLGSDQETERAVEFLQRCGFMVGVGAIGDNRVSITPYSSADRARAALLSGTVTQRCVSALRGNNSEGAVASSVPHEPDSESPAPPTATSVSGTINPCELCGELDLHTVECDYNETGERKPIFDSHRAITESPAPASVEQGDDLCALCHKPISNPSIQNAIFGAHEKCLQQEKRDVQLAQATWDAICSETSQGGDRPSVDIIKGAFDLLLATRSVEQSAVRIAELEADVAGLERRIESWRGMVSDVWQKAINVARECVLESKQHMIITRLKAAAAASENPYKSVSETYGGK